ncbi:hypothetical protein PLICRDRAFT_66197, partial [Plicaturopsis crispa FD-325 SS-3]
QLLVPTAEYRSFEEFAVTEGPGCTEDTSRVLRIGIDICLWIARAQHGVHHASAQAGLNPEMRSIFTRLARLYQAPVTPIFVFDGPDRPPIKRGKRVSTQPNWMNPAVKELLRGFGFRFYEAPGEAEAELAQLNCAGVVDAIITDDADAFVFGAVHVVRKYVVTDRTNDEVSIYSSHAIMSTPSVSLSLGGLLLVALLGGGDYDQVGLAGCGPSTAQRLSQYGLGDSLLAAVTRLPPQQWEGYLVGWRNDLRKYLRSDPCGHLGQRLNTLAASITDTFPDLGVLAAYARPATSWSKGQSGPPAESIQPRHADLSLLVTACQHHFGWGPSDICVKFEKHIARGVLTRALLDV